MKEFEGTGGWRLGAVGDWRKADPSNHRGRAWGQVLMNKSASSGTCRGSTSQRDV